MFPTLWLCERFPSPSKSLHKHSASSRPRFFVLVRAADLIGQLSDPRYLQKIPALFYEFEETGANKTLGYCTPEDLRKNYPTFYRNVVFPYIQPALRYLELTLEGKQIVAHLYANVFRVEHELTRSARNGSQRAICASQQRFAIASSSSAPSLA